MTDLFVKRRAWFSDCRRYRYMLEIIWGDHGCPILVVVMANPSKADEFANDPTVARIEERARRRGFGGVVILNAFAYMATDPDDMYAQDDPVGPFNDEYLRATLGEAHILGHTIMVGWGEIGRHRDRHLKVAEILKEKGIEPVCLRISKTGQPGHPLYIGYDQPFIPWPLAA